MAIAFDASVGRQFNGGGTSSLTWAHTCTGSDRLLEVGVFFGGNPGDILTGITYNGVAMSFVAKVDENGAGNFMYVYKLANPASGSNNVIVSTSAIASIQGRSVSYTGCSGTINASATNTVSAVSTIAGTVTTTVANCWLTALFRNDIDSSATAGAGTTLRSSDGLNATIMGDSNGALSAASHSLNYQWSGSSTGGVVVVAIEPVSVAPTVLGRMFEVF